ncbi:endogenous inhibitor of DNA gyrase (YacG/DUF329 family) [Nitrobacteraceae bacterium AZCC 2146]
MHRFLVRTISNSLLIFFVASFSVSSAHAQSSAASTPDEKTKYLLVGLSFAKKYCVSRGYAVTDNTADWFRQNRIDPTEYASGPKRARIDDLSAKLEADFAQEGEAEVVKMCKEIAISMPQTVQPNSPTWLQSAQKLNDIKIVPDVANPINSVTPPPIMENLNSGIGLFLIGLVIGLIPATIAWRKGLSFWAYWIGGVLFFIVVLPVAIFSKRDENELERRRLARGGSPALDFSSPRRIDDTPAMTALEPNANQPSETSRATFLKWGYLTNGKEHYSSPFLLIIGWVMRIALGISGGAFLGMVVAIYGHPIAGLVAGLLVFMLALASGIRKYGIWKGRCPHCERPVVAAAQPAFNCPICTKRIVIENQTFAAV